MRIAAIGLGVLVALGSGAALAAGGGSAPSGGGSFNMPERQMTPEEQAKQAYNQGVRAVKAADKLAKSAEETTDEKKKAKVLDKAKHQYENARGYFASALQRKVDMYEAWNYVGYTSRKLGEYDKALQAYDEALRLNPNYGEAIEYRGEAYLALNRIEDAKNAYMLLFQGQRPLADQLMVAMQKWVTDRRPRATPRPKSMHSRSGSMSARTSRVRLLRSRRMRRRSCTGTEYDSPPIDLPVLLDRGRMERSRQRPRAVPVASAAWFPATARSRRQSDVRCQGRARLSTVLRNASLGNEHVFVRQLPPS